MGSGKKNSNILDIENLNKKLEESFSEEENIEKSDETKEIQHIEEFIENECRSYMIIDRYFIKFLKNFVYFQYQREKLKNRFKNAFFWIIMLGFLILLISPFLIILFAKTWSEITILVALIATLIELVSAIIVLPGIIAEYLFNKEEDSNMVEIIKNMQEYNEKKHDHINKKQ